MKSSSLAWRPPLGFEPSFQSRTRAWNRYLTDVNPDLKAWPLQEIFVWKPPTSGTSFECQIWSRSQFLLCETLNRAWNLTWKPEWRPLLWIASHNSSRKRWCQIGTIHAIERPKPFLKMLIWHPHSYPKTQPLLEIQLETLMPNLQLWPLFSTLFGEVRPSCESRTQAWNPDSKPLTRDVPDCNLKPDLKPWRRCETLTFKAGPWIRNFKTQTLVWNIRRKCKRRLQTWTLFWRPTFNTWILFDIQMLETPFGKFQIVWKPTLKPWLLICNTDPNSGSKPEFETWILTPWHEGEWSKEQHVKILLTYFLPVSIWLSEFQAPAPRPAFDIRFN